MAIPTIGSVPDVVAGQPVMDDWGQAVGSSTQGRTVHRFSSIGARDSAIPTPVRGMLAATTDTDTLWQAQGSGPTWLPAAQPCVYYGSYTGPVVGIGATQAYYAVFTANGMPAGIYALFGQVFVNSGGGQANVNMYLDANQWLGAQSHVIGSTQMTVPMFAMTGNLAAGSHTFGITAISTTTGGVQDYSITAVLVKRMN